MITHLSLLKLLAWNNMSESYQSVLQNYLFNTLNCSPEAIDWIKNTIDETNNSDDILNTACFHSAAANRMLADIAITIDAPIISIDDYKIYTRFWAPADFYRCMLFLSITSAYDIKKADFVNTYFRFGDEQERASLVKMLILIDNPSTYKSIALESGRSNSLLLFSALALNNPFPAIMYTEQEYNQLVMKSLFMGLPISKICGINKRSNNELSRMCEDYIDERLLANRKFPTDIWLALVPYISNNGLKCLSEYLGSENDEHRYFSALAISEHKHLVGKLEISIEQRMELETIPEISTLLQLILSN